MEDIFKLEAKPCRPLEWGDESIDVITVCCAFHYFDNSQGFVNECGRVLKKNGAAYIGDLDFGAVGGFIANNLRFPISKNEDVRVYSKKELEQIFLKCGFKTVQVYRKGRGVFQICAPLSLMRRELHSIR